MRRAFPYLVAAAAGAAVFQLAMAQAQVDRRPLRDTETVRLVEGFSNRGNYQEALDDATSRALRALPGADRQVSFKVREVSGDTGGIRGGSRLRVLIEVPGEDVGPLGPDRGPLPDRELPDRGPLPDRGDDRDAPEMDRIRRDVETEVRAPRAVERGEAVPISFVLTNTGEDTVRIPLNTGQKYEFEIWRDNRMVWRWSQGRFFTQALGSTELRPNEELTYRISWDQRNTEGTRVPAGTYQVRAYVPTRWQDFRVGNSATFTIR
jgi:hypothetical protein